MIDSTLILCAPFFPSIQAFWTQGWVLEELQIRDKFFSNGIEKFLDVNWAFSSSGSLVRDHRDSRQIPFSRR